jgi:hypothetical protein
LTARHPQRGEKTVHRRTTKRYGFARLAAGAIALLLLGVLASGALADGDPFSPLGALTGSTTTSSDTTGAFSTSSDTTGTSTNAAATTEATTTTASTSSSSTSALSPAIATDQSDYAPGSTVTLTGSGWGAGESVHLVVNDTVGATWQYTTNLLADQNGGITLQFQLPDYFVSDYDVTATGAASEVATASFTDGNVQTATVDVRTSGCVTSSTTFALGEVVCAHSVIGTVTGQGTETSSSVG